MCIGIVRAKKRGPTGGGGAKARALTVADAFSSLSPAARIPCAP